MRDQLFDYVVSGLKSRKGQWTGIARATGLSTKTLSRIVNGENNNRRDTLLVLAEHFKANTQTADRSAAPPQ